MLKRGHMSGDSSKSLSVKGDGFVKRIEDLTGKRFAKLVVIEQVWRNGATHWRCKCDCGNEAVVINNHLVKGYTKSCGCLRAEFCKSDKINRTYIDGRIHERLYRIYYGMIERCANPQSIAYPNYGSRGISVCDEWLNNYESFREWAYNSGYRKDLTIDRIDVNGNYEPSNCRWADIETQNYNKRNTVYHTICGKEYTFVDLAKKYKVDIKKLRYRYYDHGRDIVTALRCLGVNV